MNMSQPQYNQQAAYRMLEATQGAWGQGKSREEIDVDINRIQEEWDRDARRL
jgi:hypothetical protein